ncbi:MAG: hypothetical protein R6U28_12675 [Cyclonatronaceae bacterium]
MRIFNYLRDFHNKLLYGKQSPLYAEQLWIDPKRVLAVDHDRMIETGWGHYSSGKVITEWPFSSEEYFSVWTLPKIKHCVLRYKRKLSWEDTGAYEHYEQYRTTKTNAPKYTQNYIIDRHQQFDDIFDTVKKENRLRTVSELKPGAFREESGILIHIGPEGELIFSETGSHRLGIALLLNLQIIPVQIGVVHSKAIPLLDGYRKKTKT